MLEITVFTVLVVIWFISAFLGVPSIFDGEKEETPSDMRLIFFLISLTGFLATFVYFPASGEPAFPGFMEPIGRTKAWFNFLVEKRQKIVREIKDYCPPKKEWSVNLPDKCVLALQKKIDFNKKLNLFIKELEEPISPNYNPIVKTYSLLAKIDKSILPSSLHKADLFLDPVYLNDPPPDKPYSLKGLHDLLITDKPRKVTPYSKAPKIWLTSPLAAIIWFIIALALIVAPNSGDIFSFAVNSFFFLVVLLGEITAWKGLINLNLAQYNKGVALISYSWITVPLLITAYVLALLKKKSEQKIDETIKNKENIENLEGINADSP